MTFHVFSVKWISSKKKWKLHRPTGTQNNSYHKTKKKAVDMGKELARNMAELEGKTAKLAIYKKNGTRQDVRTYKPGEYQENGTWSLI